MSTDLFVAMREAFAGSWGHVPDRPIRYVSSGSTPRRSGVHTRFPSLFPAENITAELTSAVKRYSLFYVYALPTLTYPYPCRLPVHGGSLW